MNRLILLNHQPTVPAFMLSAIKVAFDRFDEVYYVNSSLPSNIEHVPNYQSVCFVSPSKSDKLFSYLIAFIKLFSTKVLKLLVCGMKDNGFSLRFIKVIYSHLHYYYSTKNVIELLLKENTTNTKCFLMSVWFSSEAFCAAEIKKRHPEIKAVSLAHSFEIFVSRDPYVAYNFNEEKLQYLDSVYFISKQGLESYMNNIKLSNDSYKEKCHVLYLGSYKENNKINTIIDKGTFNICTCSRTIPLKRLDVLCDALAIWNTGKVIWTHLGSGVDDEKLKINASTIMKSNPHVTIVFKGRLPNEKVKEFYAEAPVDVFVNLSTIEGLPISIMEALSFGIPVIATDVGGTKEIVSKDVGVLLSPDITPSLVKDTLNDYYELSEERKDLYRKKAYQQWESNFNADKNFNLLYDSLLK